MSVTGFFADLRRHLASALWLARAQKVRFLLTVSGVVVGVASLVTIASLLHVAEGVLESASSQAKGDDLVVVENDWQKLFSDPAARSLDQRDVGDLSGSTLLGATDVAALGRMTDLKAQRDGREFSVKAMGAPPRTARSRGGPRICPRRARRRADRSPTRPCRGSASRRAHLWWSCPRRC
jgi:hypothetical protein